MHRDFHYFGTYLAARGAGIPPRDALDICEYAELIDEAFNPLAGDRQTVANDAGEYYWNVNQWNDGGGKKNDRLIQRTVTAIATPNMVVNNMKGAWFNESWAAFHFLPNLDPKEAGSEYQERYALKEEEFKKGKYQPTSGDLLFKEQQLICYPQSKLAGLMLQDTIDMVTARRGETQDEETFVKNYIANHINSKLTGAMKCEDGSAAYGDFDDGPWFGFDLRLFKLAMLGVRVHVFVDLWAHQGFCGPRSPRINDLDPKTFEVWRKGDKDFVNHAQHESYRKDEHDKALAPVNSHIGHGNANRLPDLPGYSFKYSRTGDGVTIYRSNPTEYAKAYRAMYDLFCKYQEANYVQDGKGSHSGWQTKKVEALHPDKLDKDFWESNFTAFLKTPRNQFLRDMAVKHDKAMYEAAKKEAEEWDWFGESDETKWLKKYGQPQTNMMMVAADAEETFGVLDAMKGNAHMKVASNDSEVLDADPGASVHKGTRSGIDGAEILTRLPYYSLAALCHLGWFKGHVDPAFDGSFNKWCNDHLRYKV